MTAAVCQGREVPASLLGEMHDASGLLADARALRTALDDDGYLLLRGAVDPAAAIAARAEVFGRLAQVGEVAAPPVDGIVTGTSRRLEMAADLGEFWRSVNEGPALRAVTHGAALTAVMSAALGVPAVAFDFMFLRAAPPARFTGLHFDYGFFTRTTEQVLTAWIALGDVPVSDGPLMVVEGSHRFDDLTAGQRGFDVARDTDRKAALDVHPADFVRERGTRLMSTDFRAGDIVVFSMLTLHGTLDNVSTAGRARLSCDVRFQPADAPRDPRYFGPRPAGTTGAGWGELNGAKPLDEPWHVR